jgi:hypothetical protein
MTIAIAIVGGLALIFCGLGTFSLFCADEIDDPSGDGKLGLGIVGILASLLGWAFTITLYILSLLGPATVAMKITGGFATALPLLALLSGKLTGKLWPGTLAGTGCALALYITLLS